MAKEVKRRPPLCLPLPPCLPHTLLRLGRGITAIPAARAYPLRSHAHAAPPLPLRYHRSLLFAAPPSPLTPNYLPLFGVVPFRSRFRLRYCSRAPSRHTGLPSNAAIYRTDSSTPPTACYNAVPPRRWTSLTCYQPSLLSRLPASCVHLPAPCLHARS